MSKKLLFVPLVIVLFALPLFAAESGPSNTVGFISFSASPSAYVPFSLPFTYYTEGHVATTAIGDILNGNTQGLPDIADFLWDQNLGSSVFQNAAGMWLGGFTVLTPGHAYWFNRNANATTIAVFSTAGEVDMSPLDLGTMQMGYNPVGLREPGTVMLADLGLTPGFTGGTPSESDQVWDQNLGQSAFLLGGTTWMGLSSGITGGHAIWIEVRNTPFDWTYTPSGTGLDSFNPIQIYTPAPAPKPTQNLQKAGKKQIIIEDSAD